MLTIHHKRHRLEPRLPHLIFIDNHYLATMQGDTIDLPIPPGSYTLRIQFGGPMPLRLINRLFHTDKTIDLSLSSTTPLQIPAKHLQRQPQPDTTVTFADRERLWNILFDIDLVAWLVSLFVTFPPLYHIISDTFFAIWIIRLIIIRKRYYKIEVDGN